MRPVIRWMGGTGLGRIRNSVGLWSIVITHGNATKLIKKLWNGTCGPIEMESCIIPHELRTTF